MAQTKTQIRDLLARAGSAPRHRFGQNFMIDQNLVRLVADAGEIQPNDLVIEVGPGTGTLTEELLARASVLAVEIDRDLAAVLRETFADNPKFSLIEGDALSGKHALNPDLLAAIVTAKAAGRAVKLVANLPYNIASPLVVELLIAGIDRLAFTVQKEVALRLKAVADSDAYGPLTVMVQLLSQVDLLRSLPPTAFWPAPKIDSALVCCKRDDRLGEVVRPFGKFVHQIFSARRKTLRKSLHLGWPGWNAEASMADLQIDPTARPETLSPMKFLELFKQSPLQNP
jgi:16S rRNA (adenine1518-N6/adenine1519-N6)-dimethyltransferase